MYWVRETKTWHILDEFLHEEKTKDGDKIVRSSTDCEKELAVPELPNGEVSPEHGLALPKGEYPKGLVCIQCAPNA